MSEIESYIYEKHTRQTLKSWFCECGGEVIEIDGERIVGCVHFPVEEKRGKCRENKEKIDEKTF